MLIRIISGGQTGVDRAALDVAMAVGIDAGGWCPPGRECENGEIPSHYPVVETPQERSTNAPGIPRSQRTEWNVRDSDATLMLQPANIKDDAGSEWTLQCAINYNKPYLIIDPFDKNAAIQITSWLKLQSLITLNIAGPSENTSPGIAAQTRLILHQVIAILKLR